MFWRKRPALTPDALIVFFAARATVTGIGCARSDGHERRGKQKKIAGWQGSGAILEAFIGFAVIGWPLLTGPLRKRSL